MCSDRAENQADLAPEAIRAPVIARLETALATAPHQRRQLVADFWSSLEARGTPVVEALPDAPAHRSVCFVWRAGTATGRVLLVANRIGDRNRRAGSLLQRVPGTDIWHVAYRLRSDHRASYQIAEDGGVQHEDNPDLLQRELTALARTARPDPLAASSIATRWSQQQSASVFALPDAPAERRAPRLGAPSGFRDEVWWSGSATVAARSVYRYRAPGRGPHPLLVLCDGDMWFGRLDFGRTIDAAVAEGVLPPLTVIAPSAIDPDSRWLDLSPNNAFVDSVVGDLPALAAELGPVSHLGPIIAGQSLGGLTALYAAARHGHAVAGVVAQSPSLWWRPGAGRVPDPSAVDNPWISEMLASSSHSSSPVKIDVGAHEGAMAQAAHSVLQAVRRSGRPAGLTVFNGGHDFACWRVQLITSVADLLARRGFQPGAPLESQ